MQYADSAAELGKNSSSRVSAAIRPDARSNGAGSLPETAFPAEGVPPDWALQLREKQKARFTYGVLEKQFRKYFEMARDNPGVTGDTLLQLLETRLDNVVFRLSFAESRQHARQLVNHSHFTVNGRRMDIPSYLVQPGDVVAWKRGGENGSVPDFIKELTDGPPKRTVPIWLRLDSAKRAGEMVALPDPSEIDSNIDVRLVVEFYSK